MFKDKFPDDFNILTDIQTHYLMSYSNNKEKLYTHSATLNDTFLKDLKTQIEQKYELPLDTFETEKEIDDKVYVFPEKDKVGLKYFNEILNLLKITTNTSNSNVVLMATKMPTPSKLKFIISHFKTPSGSNVLLFTKQDRIGVPNKKKAWKFNGKDDFTVVDLEDIYLFNSFPTCIIIDEKIFVIDYKGFIEIFGYKQHLEKHVSQVINMLDESSIISNVSQYKEHFNKYRYFNALTKIPNDPTVVTEFIKTNDNDIKNITKDYEVHFDYNPTNNNFKLHNEEGIKILIRLLSDRAGFNLARDFITYPTSHSIKRKAKPNLKRANKTPKKPSIKQIKK